MDSIVIEMEGGVLRSVLTFREFVVNRDIINTSQAFTTGLEVVGVDEENNMSENEQNEFFTTSDIDDFLNFSEDNPFGDPENQ